jgi:hypothetical protein
MPSRPKKPDLYAGHHDPPLIRAPRIESAGADRRSNPATHAEHRHAAEPPIPSRESVSARTTGATSATTIPILKNHFLRGERWPLSSAVGITVSA